MGSSGCDGARGREQYLSGKRILPKALTGSEPAADVVENAFLAYNGARLREGARLFAQKMLSDEVTVGCSLAGALTPAGLGPSCLVPLIEAGFIDWLVATGANLYHDLHFAFNCELFEGRFDLDDAELYEAGVVRIYDVLLGRDECLLATDVRLRAILQRPEFQRTMGTSELHHMLGGHCARAEEEAGLGRVSVLAAAYRNGVPVYTSSPGDSTIGLEVAAIRFGGSKLVMDSIVDVNETTAIVRAAKQPGRRSAVLFLGGGSPKNFTLQTVPHLTDSLGLESKGHDYFLQVTDARPDTGGLSGATPNEAVSWGKVDPDYVPDAVVCYTDTTLALPLLASYALANREPREPKRLYDVREELVEKLKAEYLAQTVRVPH
ncbi:MAG: homospermidine biosynthesis protein [Planctomycetota bacterium]|jgi:deoxyhypusine synthase